MEPMRRNSDVDFTRWGGEGQTVALDMLHAPGVMTLQSNAFSHTKKTLRIFSTPNKVDGDAVSG